MNTLDGFRGFKRNVVSSLRTALRHGSGVAAVLVLACVSPNGSWQLEELAILEDRAVRLHAAGEYRGALASADEALEVVREAYSASDPRVAPYENFVAALLFSLGKYSAAETHYLRALDILGDPSGPFSDEYAVALNDLGLIAIRRGQFETAEYYLSESMRLSEENHGPNHPEFAASLNNLALYLHSRGEFDRARSLYLRSLSIQEHALGENDPACAITLINLAALSIDSNDYRAAERLAERSLGIWETELESVDHRVADTLDVLTVVYVETQRNLEAKETALRSLSVREQALGASHPDVATSLNNLARVSESLGEMREAEAYYLQSISLTERVFGPNSSELAKPLTNLAELYRGWNRAERSLPLLGRALRIAEKNLGANHPDVAIILFNLGQSYSQTGEYGQATKELERSIAIYTRTFGESHGLIADSLFVLGENYFLSGNLPAASEALQEAIEIWGAKFGESGLKLGLAWRRLADITWESGNPTDAVELYRRAVRIEEKHAFPTGALLSERSAYLLTRSIQRTYQSVLSLHALIPEDPAARQLAVELVLRRKGLVLELMAQRDRASRSNTANVTSLPQRSEYTPDIGSQLEAVQTAIELGDTELTYEAIQLAQIHDKLGTDAALIEFVLYFAYDAPSSFLRGEGDARYGAFLIRAGQPTRWFSLEGDVSGAAGRFLRAARDPHLPEGRVRQLGNELYDLIVAPMTAALEGTSTLIISPDFHLNLVPFSALVDEEGKYLIERFLINYVTTSRDLLHSSDHGLNSSASMVLADPDYGSSADADLLARVFRPLPGTRDEGRAVASILGVEPRLGAEATERLVKGLSRPFILHIATHGFFGGEDANATRVETGGRSHLGDRVDSVDAALRRSGIALANANEGGDPPNDGILTSEEVAELDLRGTELVVLSACETGLGEVLQAEGVVGLRRAVMMAGARAQVVSLWKVDDDATRDLMVAYYDLLVKGFGRAEALNHVQRKIAKSGDRSHPFYWASFIPIGAMEPLVFRR